MTATPYVKRLKLYNTQDEVAIPTYQLLVGSHLVRVNNANPRPLVVLNVLTQPTIHSIHWELITNIYSCFMNFADAYDVTWMANVNDRFFDLPPINNIFTYMDADGVFGVTPGLAGQLPTTGYLFDIAARLTRQELERIFDQMLVGHAIGFDLPSVDSKDPKPLPQLKRERLTDIHGTCWIVTTYPNKLQRTEYLHDFGTPWALPTGSVCFSVSKIGSRLLVVAKKTQIHFPAPIPLCRVEIMSSKPTIEEALAKAPFNGLSHDVSAIKISPNNFIFQQAVQLIDLGVKTIAFVFPPSLPEYVYTFVEYVSGTTITSLEVPRSLLVVAIKHATGMVRDAAGWQNLVLTVKASSSMIGCSQTDPIMHSKAVMIISAYAYIATLPFESKAINAVLGVRTQVSKLKKLTAEAFDFDKPPPVNYAKRMILGLLFGGSAIAAVKYYSNRQQTAGSAAATVLAPIKFRMLSIGGMVAAIALGFIYLMRRPRSKPNDGFEFHSTCPSAFFNNEDYGIVASDHSNCKIDGQLFDLSACDCKASLVATTKTFFLEDRPPVFPSQCVTSLGLACITRMNQPRTTERVAPQVLAEYRDSLITLFNSTDLETSLTGQIVLNVSDFKSYVNKFSGVKKRRLLVAHTEINEDPLRTQKQYFKREGFVKLEAYFKASATAMALFKPRLIISYSPHFVAENGPLYHAYTEYIKHTLSLENGVNLRRRLRYHMASGMTAEDLGDWYAYAQNRAEVACNRMIEENRHVFDGTTLLNRFTYYVIEMDQTAFDGHYHEDVKAVQELYKYEILCTEQAAHFRRIEEPIFDQKFSKKHKTPSGSVKLEFSRPGNHDSGKLDTTASNSIRNCAPLEMARSQTEKRFNVELVGDIIVLGDDNLIFLVGDDTVLRWFLDAYNRICEEISLKAKVLVHLPCYEDSMNFTPQASFCNGYFYPVLRGGAHTFLWGPKLGRVLGKLLINKNLDIRYEDYLESILLAYRFCFPALPIFNVLWHRLRRDFHGKQVDIELPWIRATVPNHFSDHSYRFMKDLYDTPEILELSQYLATAPYGPLKHPLLDVIIRQDLGEDEAFGVTQRRLQFMGRSFNYKPALNAITKLLKTVNTIMLDPAKIRTVYMPTVVTGLTQVVDYLPKSYPLSLAQPGAAVAKFGLLSQLASAVNLSQNNGPLVPFLLSSAWGIIYMRGLTPGWFNYSMIAVKLLTAGAPLQWLLTWAFQVAFEENLKESRFCKYMLILGEAFMFSHNTASFWFQLVLRYIMHTHPGTYEQRFWCHLVNNLNQSLIWTPQNGFQNIYVRPTEVMMIPSNIMGAIGYGLLGTFVNYVAVPYHDNPTIRLWLPKIVKFVTTFCEFQKWYWGVIATPFRYLDALLYDTIPGITEMCQKPP